MKDAYSEIIKDDGIWKSFTEADNAVNLPLDAQKKIFEKIVTKAFHARAGEATKRYKEDKLDAADMALRPKLKATSGSSGVTKKLDFGVDESKNNK